FVEAGITFQRCRMQLEFVEDRSNAPKPVLRIFQRDAPDDPVDFITLLEKELGQIGSVLTGDSRNERLSSQTTSFRLRAVPSNLSTNPKPVNIPGMWVIRAEKVSKCFRIYRKPSDRLKELLTFGKRRFHEPFWAVKDVDVQVERGCCLGIIGENGSGKSTLLRMIAGVIRPSSGNLAVGGRVSALLELGAGFNPLFTGRENIFLYAAILGFTDAQTRERIPSIEKFAEIGEFVDRPVKTYSSGMFVRLAFAVAIHMDPDILIVDEALSVGDIFFQQRCIRRIQQLQQQGVTVLFLSHELDALRSLADRTIWMEHGRVRLEGKTDEVVSKYLAAMVTRGRKEIMEEEAIGTPLGLSPDLDLSDEALSRIPKFLEHVPNVDHRYGNGKARVLGIGVY